MDSSRPLQSVDPRPMSSPGVPAQQPYQQQSYQPSSYQDAMQHESMSNTMPQHRPDTLPQHASPHDLSQPHPPQPGIGLHMGPEAHIPDHPGSTYDIPRPPTQTFTGQLPVSTTTPPPKDLRNVRASAMFQLREYMTLQNKSKRMDGSVSTLDLQNQMRNQSGLVVLELKRLQADLRDVAKKGEDHRWRRWLVGGAIATFIPLVRRIFRRSDDEESQLSANDTEYAWNRSQGLIARIKDLILGKGNFASIAFFVFAVLYVFQNEVKLRVARTIRKRVRKLCTRIEAGDETIDDADLKIFDGWRWRIVL